MKLTLDQFHALELWVIAASWRHQSMATIAVYDARRQAAFDLLVEPVAIETTPAGRSALSALGGDDGSSQDLSPPTNAAHPAPPRKPS